MARTYHHHNRAASSTYWRKEAKPARRVTTRALRRANRDLAASVLRFGADPDAVAAPVFRGTSGRLTW